ncbi:RNA polymerase sigma-70 factor [Bacillus manliponensis]|uniref:RNA polymerase sigma-70 factor n=1 Tax=Bacillus manliponensis TaxID=574376 RepID=UPI0035164CAE
MEREKLDELYVTYKPFLCSFAYKMTGSMADAEDVVQDIFLKLNEYELKNQLNIKAFLCKLVTNRCLDVLKSAQKKRELYIGTWLPEPIVFTEKDPLQELLVKHDVSYALLLLFETLNPIERAVFILREYLECDYKEISEIVQKTEENCRKILSRIKKTLPEMKKKEGVENSEHEQMITTFIQDIRQGNTKQVMEVLKEDVVYYADGGGKVRAALKPIYGMKRIRDLLIALAQKFIMNQEGYTMIQTKVNESIGIVIKNQEGVQSVICFEFEGDKIKAIYNVLNPDKLRGISL